MLEKNALTTLEQARKHLGIPDTDTSRDESIEFLINAASSLIEKYCSRKFGLNRYQELLTGRGSLKLVLNHYPITELHAIDITQVVGSESVDVTKVHILPNGMLYRPNGGFPDNRLISQFMHPNYDQEVHNIFVDYSAGYVLPKDATEDNPRTLPYDLELACLKMISNMKRDKEISTGSNTEGNLVMTSESIGDWSASYQQAVKTDSPNYTKFISPDVETILCEYKQGDYFV